MCLGFITIFCPLNISFPTNAQAKWKNSSKTALLRIHLIIDSAKRGKKGKEREGKKRHKAVVELCPGAAVVNSSSSQGKAEHTHTDTGTYSCRSFSLGFLRAFSFAGRKPAQQVAPLTKDQSLITCTGSIALQRELLSPSLHSPLSSQKPDNTLQ